MTPETYTLLTEYLSRYYDATLYQRHGIAHPVIWHAVTNAQATAVNSITGYLSEDSPTRDSMGFYNYAHLHTLQNSGRNLFNGTTYVMRQLRTNPLRLDAAPGKYFDMIATCGALETEILDVIGGGMIRLPMRTQYHRSFDAQQSLSSGKGRSAAIGGVMLTVFNDKGTYRAIISQRTTFHATRPGAIHLLPAFIFQPMSDERLQSDWRFKQHLYREYLEELTGMAEGDTAMEQHPALMDLQAMEADGRAHIRLTGVSINLLTLRPEISALLVIHDPAWWQQMQSGERGYRLTTPEAQAASLRYISFIDDESVIGQLPTDYHLNMVPQAIPALWAGIDAARLLITAYRG